MADIFVSYTKLDLIREMLAQEASPTAITGAAGWVSPQVIDRVRSQLCVGPPSPISGECFCAP